MDKRGTLDQEDTEVHESGCRILPTPPHMGPGDFQLTCSVDSQYTRWSIRRLRLQTSNCSLLLIYLPQKDERLSRPGWLTYSGWFTHISGHLSAAGRAQNSVSLRIPDVWAHLTGNTLQLFRVRSFYIIVCQCLLQSAFVRRDTPRPKDLRERRSQFLSSLQEDSASTDPKPAEVFLFVLIFLKIVLTFHLNFNLTLRLTWFQILLKLHKLFSASATVTPVLEKNPTIWWPVSAIRWAQLKGEHTWQVSTPDR